MRYLMSVLSGSRRVGVGIACVFLLVTVPSCGHSKAPDIPCVADSDCPADLSYCDGEVIECSELVRAIIGGVCRKDQYHEMQDQSCTTDSDCKSTRLVCAICSPGLNCPTCQFPIPGCAVGPGSCGQFSCQASVIPASCAAPCQMGGPCNKLFLYKDKCPDLTDGGVEGGIGVD